MPGVIEPGVLYGLREFKSRVRLGNCALRSARTNGLVVRYKQNRAFVVGSDWIDYVRRQGPR